ncbi:MAG: LysR family transcriptional regulator, partial [Rhodobacterales bacterium]|nr:LysR family transcriptional regulator [Rhodobacterales bacterium]
MELYQIRYFLALCETMNFTRAAEACNVSQPALTRAVKRLEEELGGELFRRERSRSHMTELGRAMRPFLQQSLDSALAAQAEARGFGRGEKAVLRLGLSATVDAGLVMPALREAARALPGLEIHLSRHPAAEALARLEDGGLELCLAALDDLTWDRIDRYPLFTEPFLVLLPQEDEADADEAAVPLASLDGRDLVTRPYCEHAGRFSALLRDRGVAVGGTHACTDPGDVAAAVAAGLGVALAPRSGVRGEDPVRARPLADADLRRTVALYAVAGRR